MASLYGVNATYLQNVPEEKIPAGEQSGRVRVAYDNYTFAASLASDTLYLQKIPKGARVLDVIVKFADLDSSTTARCDIGWSGDPDGFFNELATNGGGCKSISGVEAAMPGMGKKFASEEQLQIVNTAGGTGSVAGAIEITMLYVIE